MIVRDHHAENGFFDLVGGPVSAGDHVFVFENKRVTDTQPYQRMIWQDVTADSFTWHMRRSLARSRPAVA